MTDADKLVIWQDRVQGWFIQITDELGRIPHGGFCLMLLVTVYYEFIAQCVSGEGSRRKERETFKSGIKVVYGDSTFDDSQLDRLWEELRCGMMHAIFPKASVVISGQYVNAFDFEGEMLKINPHKMLVDVQNHFQTFSDRLRDPAEKALLGNVLKYFDQAASMPRRN